MIGIPWRPTPERQEILDQLLIYLGEQLPKWPIIFADSGHEPFNRAATRNLLVEQIAYNSPVAVLLDADTFVHPRALQEAVQTAEQSPALVYPFQRCLIRRSKDQIPELRRLRFPTSGGYSSTGGCYVVQPEVWRAFGGQDEQFVGWGGDDDATYIAAATLARVARRRGVAVSIGHPALRFHEDPHFAAAGQRMHLYRALRGRPDEMREFFAAGRPLDWPVRDRFPVPRPEFP